MSDKLKERISLRSVLDKIEKAAEEQYDGRIYENILAIFKELEISEQRVFLRGLVNICLTFKTDLTIEKQHELPVASPAVPEAPPVVTSLPIPMPVSPPKPQNTPTPAVPQNFPTDLDAAGSLEEYNARELIKLKSWVVRKLVTNGFWLLVIVVGCVAYFGDRTSLMKTVEYFIEMIKTALGF